jgi:hypothetical protein
MHIAPGQIIDAWFVALYSHTITMSHRSQQERGCRITSTGIGGMAAAESLRKLSLPMTWFHKLRSGFRALDRGVCTHCLGTDTGRDDPQGRTCGCQMALERSTFGSENRQLSPRTDPQATACWTPAIPSNARKIQTSPRATSEGRTGISNWRPGAARRCRYAWRASRSAGCGRGSRRSAAGLAQRRRGCGRAAARAVDGGAEVAFGVDLYIICFSFFMSKQK